MRIARMAGQYAKPRSKPTEMHEGKEIPSFRYVGRGNDGIMLFIWCMVLETNLSIYILFRGDNVNGFDPSDRQPDPERLLQ